MVQRVMKVERVVNVFISRLFNDAVSGSAYTASKYRIINKQ
jgi:hypothetical protein